jgi:flagellar biosynthesis activator protein FlaF
MQHAAQAYGSIAKQTASPRELEAGLLLKAAAQLQTIKDNWERDAASLDSALLYNRKLWTIFMAAVTDNNHPLPANIRQNIANLGIFVMKQTVEVLAKPAPERLSSLININRELASGLRQQTAA